IALAGAGNIAFRDPLRISVAAPTTNDGYVFVNGPDQMKDTAECAQIERMACFVLHVPVRRILVDKGKVTHVESSLAEVQIGDEAAFHEEGSRLPVNLETGDLEEI